MNDLQRLEVLVIDDDADTRANLRDILELDGHRVDSAGSIAEALRVPDWQRFFAVILDRRLPDGSAEALLPKIKLLAPQAAVIIVTGYADLDAAIAAIRQGAADFIIKPVNPDIIRSRLAGLADRRRAEQEIARLNADLRILLEVLPAGIAGTQDVEATSIRVNPALARILDVAKDEPLTLPIDHVVRRILRRAAAGEEVRGEEHPLGDRSLYIVAAPLRDERGAPRGAFGAFLDVTERKHEQERLLHAERLAAVGEMMTVLAHESGNALARSQSCLEMLAWEVEDRPEVLDLIQRIQSAQKDLKQLYDEVRGYASPLKLEREDWSVSAVWRQSWQHLSGQRQGRDTELSEDADGVETICSIDPFRLDQVFRNIFENSLIACGDPVRIVVRCGYGDLDGRPALLVSVADNGPGLGPEQRRRIFEPFFTTRSKGTGLGMAIAKRIVEAHGGRIAVGESGPGAELLITLPRNAS